LGDSNRSDLQNIYALMSEAILKRHQ
jgi:hypothetical protein